MWYTYVELSSVMAVGILFKLEFSGATLKHMYSLSWTHLNLDKSVNLQKINLNLHKFTISFLERREYI
jgi:hypothetical protein